MATAKKVAKKIAKKVVVAPKKVAMEVVPKTPLKAGTKDVPAGYTYVGMGGEFKVNPKDNKVHFVYITPGQGYSNWQKETRSYVSGYNPNMAFAFKDDSEVVKLNSTPVKQASVKRVVNPKLKQPKGGDKVPVGYVCIGQGKDYTKQKVANFYYRQEYHNHWQKYTGSTFTPDSGSNWFIAVPKNSELHKSALVGGKEPVKKNPLVGYSLHPARNQKLPAANAKSLPEGYAYIGDNNDLAGKSISDFKYSYDYDADWRDHSGSYTPNTGGSILFIAAKIGSDDQKAAYMTKAAAAKWKPFVAADLSLEKQVELAGTLTGKHVSVRNAGVRKYTNFSVAVAGGNLSDYNSTLRDFAHKHKKPFVVVDLNGYKYPIFDLLEIAPEPVVINGYTGVEHKDYWVFGCATIDKPVLKAAKDFLESTAKLKKSGNRNVEYVTIGSANFTLDTLKKLVK